MPRMKEEKSTKRVAEKKTEEKRKGSVKSVPESRKEVRQVSSKSKRGRDEDEEDEKPSRGKGRSSRDDDDDDRPAKKGAKSSKRDDEDKKPAKKTYKGTPVIGYDDASSRAKKLIAQADKYETAVEDAKQKFAETLEELQEELGQPSFEHPDRGPMTIMHRGSWFWRSKPAGK